MPVLSKRAKISHPIPMAEFGNSDIPNLAPAETSVPMILYGKYEAMYRIAPAAAPALAVNISTVH